MKASILSNNISGGLAYPRLLAAPRIRISRVFGCLFTITSNPPSCTFSSLAAMSGVDAPEMEWPAKKVRDTFIKFLEGKNHVNWKSSPVVPHNDPTLLFANAGMNQFKPIFLGTVDPNTAMSKLTRACNTQKCIRAGGKQNDLDDVGKDTYHHTFFEMLGNWSFGNYFKKDAIEWAWELLTKVYSLPTDRIYATYFGGDDKAGLPPDNEAKDIWLKFLPPEPVLPFGCKDNFWEMGDTGPCGPCTEIHYDRVGNRNAASLVNNDDPSCIEIWNLVFIQVTEVRPYSGKVGPDDFEKVDMAYRVVADHIRTLSFPIADGASPALLCLFQDAFILWDTYGFPLDLTQLMAEERGLIVDIEGFNNAKDEAREKSRSARNKQAGGAIVMDADATSALHRKGVSTTDDSFKFIWFQDHESVIKAIYTGSEFVESVSAGDDVGIVLESTSFYAEQGGQSGNEVYGFGDLLFGRGQAKLMIFDTGSLDGSFGSFQVDYDRRRLIAPNHTYTHMLNFALREVLGDHVDQKGSIVLPEKLRFDFSHDPNRDGAINADHLRKIESIVNEQIKAELDVYSKEATLAEANRINGLRAVFGEVYPDPVRVVAIGRKVEDLLANPENREWSSISSELCGGTHITNTREAKAFALLSEKGIAKGVRRITAVTTESALKAMELGDLLLQEVDDASKMEVNLLEKKVASLKTSVDSASIPAAKKADIRAKIVQLLNQLKKAQKKIAEQNMQKAVTIAIELAELAAKEGKTFCISRIDVGLDAAALREAVSKVIQQKFASHLCAKCCQLINRKCQLWFSVDETTNKAVVYAGVPEKSESIKRLEVSEWLTKALGPLKGKCGRGKGGLAAGQGTDASRVNEAIDLATSFASMKLR
ncbi:alanine--tRNA ligase-like [Gossypium australe]|uniref:Alanine--tRNA ligase n=1 Tax=Gossypium australe TaxID=47621 RepID=A0A5B6V0D9_9ROSI|nr:alanine--tRNA ligase-like [Gossypium australe]